MAYGSRAAQGSFLMSGNQNTRDWQPMRRLLRMYSKSYCQDRGLLSQLRRARKSFSRAKEESWDWDTQPMWRTVSWRGV